MEKQKYLRSRDIMKMFSVTPGTLYNWRREGMPYSGSGKMLFYEETKVTAWLNNRDSIEKIEELIKSIYPK